MTDVNLIESGSQAKIIMRDSDEAAQLKTVTGWVSRDGIFFGNDERTARYSGCTHFKCECGNIAEKGWFYCDDCRHKLTLARYEALPIVEWDGETPLCTYDDDRYFFDEESVHDYCDENDCKVADLMLVLCEPQFAREIDQDEYFCDYLPEDSTLEDVAPELAEAFEKLNESIRNYKKPLSWTSGKTRVVLEERTEDAGPAGTPGEGETEPNNTKATI